jgi:hypothetical protein
VSVLRGHPIVVRSTLLCLAGVLVLAPLLDLPASGSDVTGGAGTDTSLPLTDSAVVVKGQGPYADLEITVNQTKNLLNQAISLTWKGGTPTVELGGGAFGSDYLQIMQCWGDDDGTNPANPGPPPEQCAFGAKSAVYGGISGSPFPPGSLATERIISRRGWDSFDASLGTFDTRTGNLWRDFVAVDGTRIGNHIDPSFNPSAEGGVYWQNPFFNIITSNEVAGARSLDNGTGAEFFEVVTGIENAGLGCGQKVEPMADGTKRVPRCWLVVVPRSDPASENLGTPFGASSGVITSPLAPEQWQHRIAIPLEFNPVDTACSLGDDSARLVGSELVTAAISSWQPVLCATPGLRPYSYGIVSDAGARQQLLANAPGAPGMYVMSKPLEQASLDPANPTVYAPLTVSGITIGFNLERRPALVADAEAQRLRGVRVASLNLTPRLLAKLLTQSYVRQVNIKVLPDYEWIDTNPDHLGEDEDFLRFNPEFRELEPVWRKEFSGLLIPAGNSDAATQLWEYVLADPEAKAWLDGKPDEWGMQVNPVYATTAAANSQGAAFAEEPPANFPKADPYCFQAPDTPQGVRPPLLCGPDWNPYTQSMRDGARLARAASDGARLEENSFAVSSDKYYSRTPPQPVGARSIMALTDTASANLFGLQMARLSRAGDNGDERSFIAPDATGLTAGVKGLTPKSEPAVLEADPTADAPGAYPLTVLTYAAIRPLALTAEARSEYAAFVDYAATAGQVSGPRYGQLPVGYAPLTEALAAQARSAAKTIRTLQPPTSRPSDAGSVGSWGFGSSLPSAAPAYGTTADATPPASTAPPPGGTTGTTEPPLELVSTPAIAVPASRFALPALAAVAVLAALAALEVTKRPRRGTTPTDTAIEAE